MGDNLTDDLIGVCQHVTEMPLVIPMVALIAGGSEPLGIPVAGVGRRVKGTMGENHRIVNEKWLLLVHLDEVANEVRADLRPVFAVGEILLFAVDFKQRIHEAAVDLLAALLGAAAARVLPQAGLVEAKVLGGILVPSELPLASDAGGVAGILDQVGEGGLLAIETTETHVIPHIVHAGHDLHP